MFAFTMRLWDNVGVDQVPDVEKTWEGEHALGSQLGSLVMIGDARCMDNVENPGCIVYWRSKASTRVCRSTFTGDMMACGDALERALFIRGLLVSLRDGDLLSEREAGGRIPLHLFTDCKVLVRSSAQRGSSSSSFRKEVGNRADSNKASDTLVADGQAMG